MIRMPAATAASAEPSTTAAEPTLTVIRHGPTEWSENGRHTGRTDLPLLASGRERARALASVLDPGEYALVLCSPLLRARETAALAGFASTAVECAELREWDYGDYEGLTTAEIHARAPDWSLWSDGAPGGESPDAVAARAELVIARAGTAAGPVLMFAHGHILRVLGARWLGQPVSFGARLVLDPATVSQLGHEHGQRALGSWNAVPR